MQVHTKSVLVNTVADKKASASSHCHCATSHETCACVQTVAEKKAWELSKQHDFELVTIMPSLVLGPVTGSRPDGTSINAFKVITLGFLWLSF